MPRILYAMILAITRAPGAYDTRVHESIFESGLRPCRPEGTTQRLRPAERQCLHLPDDQQKHGQHGSIHVRSPWLAAYLRSGLREVEGWLTTDTVRHVLRLDEIQASLGIRGGLGEIGVHHGKFFILLYLLAREDERAVALDLFEQQQLNLDGSGRGDRAVFDDNLARHAGGGERVAILATDSIAVSGEHLRAAAGSALRLLSLDGGHLAHVVRHDLRTARDAICEGGVIVLDDYPNPEFPGVSEGTAAWFLSGECGDVVPFLIATNKLYLTTRAHAETYMDRIARSDLGRALVDLPRFRFLDGPASPIIVTELFGRTVLTYSPQRYSATHRFRRSLRRAIRRLRGVLGQEAHRRLSKDSLVGRALRRVGRSLRAY